MEVKLNIVLFTFRNQDANQVKYTALTALEALISLLVQLIILVSILPC